MRNNLITKYLLDFLNIILAVPIRDTEKVSELHYTLLKEKVSNYINNKSLWIT